MKEQTTNTKESTTLTKDQGNWLERTVSQHFTVLLTVLALCGGAVAILLPWALNLFDLTGQVDSNLRLHILYVTGGVIAVLGLVETHRKNTVDHEKAKVEKENYKKTQAHQTSVLKEQQRQFNVTMDHEREKIKADKAKNEQDHIRQVHAERRSRYTTAIEQLSNDKASIRLGGVYALIGLADEWLADKYGFRQEGQIIINNLCAYIRSPFDLDSKHEELSQDQVPKDYEGGAEKFNEDRGRFREEKDIRLVILNAFKTRCDSFFIIFADGTQEIIKGSWSYLDYDFSNAYFFYAVNFTYSCFDASSNFSGAIFTQGADFSGATFHSEPIFISELKHASFSYRVNPEDYKFEVSPDSPYKIKTEEKEHNGIKFIIPKGTTLFSPDNPPDQDTPPYI